MKENRMNIWKMAFGLLLAGVFFQVLLNPCLGANLPRLDASTPIHGSTLGYNRVVAYQDDTITFTIFAPDQVQKKYFFLGSLTPPPNPPFLFGGNYVGVDIYNAVTLKKGFISSSGVETFFFPVNFSLPPGEHAWFQLFIIDSTSPWGFYSSNGMDLRILPEIGRFIAAAECGVGVCRYDLKKRKKVFEFPINPWAWAQSSDLNIILQWQVGIFYQYFDVGDSRIYEIQTRHIVPCLSLDGDFIVCRSWSYHDPKYELYNTHTKQTEVQGPSFFNSDRCAWCSSSYGRYIFLAGSMITPSGEGPGVAVIETPTGNVFYSSDDWGPPYYPQVACTPDGKYAVIFFGRELFVLERETMARTKIADTAVHSSLGWCFSRSVDISPNGNLVAWQDFDDHYGQSFVYIYDRSTGNTKKFKTHDILAPYSGYYSMNFSKDEKTLIFTSDTAGLSFALWVYDIPNEVLTPFWPSGPELNIFWNCWIN